MPADPRLSPPSAARVLDLEIPGAEEFGGARERTVPVVARAFVPADERQARAAALGGLGLATALFVQADAEPPPLVVAVGSAVVRGLPTAQRASVLTRALHGRIADGQVGTSLGRRLAALADALVLSARAPRARADVVVELRAQAVILHLAPDLHALPPHEVLAALGERWGDGAALVVGPAAFSPLGGLTAGECGRRAPTSFVGRGGVGTRLAQLGVRALFVGAEAALEGGQGDTAATRFRGVLERSPRLAARAAGGTLELFGAHAAAGELVAPPGREAADWAREITGEVSAHAPGRHGCKGCPTPCGVVFEGIVPRPQGARFGALEALAARLGLAGVDEALALLARCDALGIDAKEAGIALHLAACARERGLVAGDSPRGDLQALVDTLDEFLAAGLDVPAFARRHGLLEEARTARAIERPGAHAELAALVAVRRSDPLRTVAEIPLSRLRAGALPADGANVRALSLVLHEEFAAAIDAAGICAFSARALLADGVVSLDELATVLGVAGGEALLAAGTAIVALQDARQAHADGDGAADPAAERYRALRAQRAAGRPLEFAAAPDAPSAQPQRRGTVRLEALGALQRALGDEPVELPLPAPVAQVLNHVAAARPAARALLFAPDGLVLPAVHRRGEWLAGDALVHDGDTLALVLALRGG